MNTMRNIGSALALMTGVLAGTGSMADTVAFYDFAEGSVGGSVTKIKNLSAAGTIYDGAPASGQTVSYSDDLPGPHLFADQSLYGTIISPDWKSLSFTSDGSTGGCVMIPNLGGRIGELGAAGDFTIEFFFKIETARDWKDFTKFFYEEPATAARQAKCVYFSTGVGIQVSASNPPRKVVTVGAWHHMAVVYTKANTTWTTYVDGQSVSEKIEILGPASETRFALGGWGTTSENFDGKLAALRISDVALTKKQFLRASDYSPEKQAAYDGVLGFWSFAEGTEGATLSSSGNLIDSTDRLTGEVGGSGGWAPTYSADVPGDRLYVGSTNGLLFAAGVKSAKFYGASNNAAGTRLRFPEFRSRVVKAGAFTLEFFFKADENYAWRNMFALYTTSDDSLKLCTYLSFNRYVLNLFGKQAGEKHITNVYPSVLGSWHHAALMWDAETQTLSYYSDYVKKFDFSGITIDGVAESLGDACFGTGRGCSNTEYFNGKICGIRLMPRRLEPAEMLVAVNSEVLARYDPDTVFHWSFEEADAVDGAEIRAMDAAPLDTPTYRCEPTHSNSRYPTYSADVYKAAYPYVAQGRRGMALSPNGFCARFYGTSDTYENIWAGSHLELRQPYPDAGVRSESFTVEMFLRRDLSGRTTGSNGQLVAGFGKSGINAQMNDSDWYIRLMFDQTTGEPRQTFYYRNPDGEEEPGVSLSGMNINDGRWHHWAITYDATTSNLVAYLDYQPKVSSVLANGFRCTTDQGWVYQFGRGFNMSGFNGWMDDIRVSRCVRPVEQFLRKGRAPSGLVIIFR